MGNREYIELADYIKDNFGGNNSEFARHMGVDRQKVGLWVRSGWVVLNGALFSHRRDIPPTE